jgi:hypothetical protein
VKEALAKVKPRELPEHLQEAFGCRLVESVELFNLLNARRIYALASAICALAARGALTNAGRIASLQLRNHLLDRPAGNELNDDESDEQDAEERRNHQQQPFEYV